MFAILMFYVVVHLCIGTFLALFGKVHYTEEDDVLELAKKPQVWYMPHLLFLFWPIILITVAVDSVYVRWSNK